MSDQFEKDILSNINSFRKNPQSIQHQIEVLHRGIGRFKPNDPFLLEIEAFLKTITSIPKMQPVVMNKVLCDVALSEVKKYVKNEDTYNPYRIGKELEGIVPKEYMVQSPALIADNGADEADTIVPKLLLNRLDTDKKGRKIVCTQDFTQIGLARIRHEDENYYVIVFAKGMPKVEGDVTISVRQKDYVDNYLYYESKFISKKKNGGAVQHKRHGQIMGSEKGSGDPDVYENQTTLTRKEASIYENVNKAFEMISPKRNGYVSRTFNIKLKKGKKEKRFEDDDGDVILEKEELTRVKDPFERRKERNKEKKEDKKEEIKGEKIETKEGKEKKVEKVEKRIEIIEEKIVEKKEKKLEDKNEDKKVEKILVIEKTEELADEPKENKEIGGSASKLKSIRRRFYGSKRK